MYDEASVIIPLNLATWLRLLCKLDPVLTGEYCSTSVRVLERLTLTDTAKSSKKKKVDRISMRKLPNFYEKLPAFKKNVQFRVS